MKKINKTYLSCAILLLFAAWIIVQTGHISERLVSNEPGPKLFPYISAVGIIVCSILSMIFDGPKEKQREGKPFLTGAEWKRLGLFFAEIILFALGMHYLGLLIAGPIMTFVFIMTLKGDKKVNLAFAILLSIVLSVIIYFAFTKIFHLVMPTGVLWDRLGLSLPF